MSAIECHRQGIGREYRNLAMKGNVSAAQIKKLVIFS